jgi:uncharacterized membrane protein YraQ (UPF0718 family)
MLSPSFESSAGNHDHIQPKNGKKALVAQAIFVLLALGLMVFSHERAQFQTMGIIFVSIVLEAFPFMLLGTLMGGFIEVFISREKITRWLPRRHWAAVFIAAGLGVIFPVCECAIVPVVRRLLQKGIPLSAAVAFLLGGPIVNPLVAASTSVAYFFDWSIVANRLIFGYFIAVTIGLLMDLLFTKNQAVREEVFYDQNQYKETSFSDRKKSSKFFENVCMAVTHAASDFFDIGRFLIIGAFFAAFLQTVIPRQVFASISGTPTLSILVMMMMALILNLCSEADAFVAASFRSIPVPLSAQMAFMVLGPMLDLKLVLMYLNVFRIRAIVVLAGLIFLIVFLSMVFFH